MRTVTDEYLAQVQGSGRQFGVYVKVYGNSAEGDALWLGDIISVDILRSCSDQLQIGACMSDMLTLETKATALFNGRLKKVEVFYRCTAPVLDWVKLGTFYVDEAVTRNGVTAVKAYDMMSRLDKRVSWVDTSKATAPTFPCKMQAMLNYLCARAGVTTDFVCEDITVEKAPDGYTAQELISYIAASHGRNARFSPGEALKFPAYEEVEKTVQYGRCYSLDNAGGSGYTVKGILFQRGGDDKIYIDGTASEYDETADGIVTAFNPFATVGITEYAWNRIGGLNYSAVSLEMPAENILEPGDVFTIVDVDGSQKKAIVMEQELSLSCTGGFVEKISCTAESKAQNRSTENRQEATEKQVAAGATSATLTEYQYLTDLSAKLNGVTYTAEKDADTGLISKISDSNGNSLEPEISAGITDVALHNAVFWAVAMARGFGKPDVLPASDGITDYFDCNLGVSGAKWENQISGGSDISLVGAELQADGSVGVYGTSSSYGLLTSPAPENGARSLYLVFKTAAVGVIKCNTHTIGAAVSPVRTGSWFGLGVDGYAGGSSIQSDQFIIAIDSSIASTSYHVAVLTRSADGLNTLYIDGTAIGTMSNSVKYGNTLGIGLIALDGKPQGSTSVLQQIKGIVVASACHDSEQVAQNTAWLKKHHGI